MSRGFNVDPASVEGRVLRGAYRIWGKRWRHDIQPGLTELPDTLDWTMIASIEPWSSRVRYERISRNIVDSGFGFTGKYLDEIALPSADFFDAAYLHVMKWGDPVFGWHYYDPHDAERAIFEFALLPLGRDQEGRLYVFGVEDWKGRSISSVPNEYRGRNA